MKKALLLTVFVVGLVALMAAPALAASGNGWWKVNPINFSDGLHTNAPGVYNTDAGFTWAPDSVGGDTYSAVAGSRSTTSDDKTDGWGTQTSYFTNGNSPHGGFATTTNYCKVCHAVHDAGTTSYRLLKNGDLGTMPSTTRTAGEGLIEGAGSARANECMYCHDASGGATEKRPYALGMVTTVRGEHTIGATVIPDSSQAAERSTLIDDAGVTRADQARGNSKVSNRDPASRSGQGGKLGCYDCHSVHGANILAFWPVGNIIRDDPSNDGVKVTDVRDGFAPDPASADRDDYQRNNFCADCHNINASWDVGLDDVREIKTSHVTGPAANGQMEVYNETKTVAWPNRAGTNAAGGIQNRGCRGCHDSNDTGTQIWKDGEAGGVATSAWPHQTIESKMLLRAGYNGENPAGGDPNRAGIIAGPGDTNRSLWKMDTICLTCHSQDTAGGGTWGVGISF